MNKNFIFAVTLLSAGFLLGTAPAHAFPKVYSPHVEYGETEIEAQGAYIFDNDDEKDGALVQKYAIGRGLTPWWFMEFYGEVEREHAGEPNEFVAVEWENRFQLAEPGEYFIDPGLYFAYEKTTQSGTADVFEAKLLLEKDIGPTTHIANFIVEKEVGKYAEEGWEYGLAWSSRWRLNERFEPGFELHSEFGEFKHNTPWREESHQFGPVFYGKLPYGLKYDIGYLFGISDGAPDGELKWVIEFEF